MSYESEKKKLIDRCKRGLALAEELDKTAVGKDGPGTVAARKAIDEYNRDLLALKEKYGMD